MSDGPPHIIDFATAKDQKTDRRDGERRKASDRRADDAKAREKSSLEEINQILGYASPTTEANRLENLPEMGEAFKRSRAAFLSGAWANFQNHVVYYATIAIAFGVLLSLILTAWNGRV